MTDNLKIYLKTTHKWPLVFTIEVCVEMSRQSKIVSFHKKRNRNYPVAVNIRNNLGKSHRVDRHRDLNRRRVLRFTGTEIYTNRNADSASH